MRRMPAMTRVEKNRHGEEFRLLCREKHLPFTKQRRAVLQAVLDLGSHPTAEDVVASAPVRKSGVSRATVYRTLEHMASMGVVHRVDHRGSAIRYDGRTVLHHHFICTRCNRVTDIASATLDAIPIPPAGNFGFLVKEHRVQLSGLCRHCFNNTTET